jgi:hypothetical protein
MVSEFPVVTAVGPLINGGATLERQQNSIARIGVLAIEFPPMLTL